MQATQDPHQLTLLTDLESSDGSDSECDTAIFDEGHEGDKVLTVTGLTLESRIRLLPFQRNTS